jgi:hypothetical protein
LEALEGKHMMDEVKELIEKIWLLKKNVCYVDVKIIDCLDVSDIHQRNVVVTKTNVKILFSFRARSFMEI